MRAFECIPNVSEGRDAAIVDACARAIESAGVTLAHRTSDAIHNRSVFTFFGTREQMLEATLALAGVASERIDLRTHRGAHPRIGALDVLPFVPFADATPQDAVELAREAAARIWQRLRIPSYFYGDAAAGTERRLLARIRAGEFEALGTRSDAADVGDAPHPRAGAIAVGARAPLVAFNIELGTDDIGFARRIARLLREQSGGLRTLRALAIKLDGGRVQVSCNVTDPSATPLHRVVELTRILAARGGVAIVRTELIGLVPRRVLGDVVSRAFDFEIPTHDPDGAS
ncbi:MAG: glutamate formimidoyltransferase [Candidatus Eremiobacteraeota bacterium]|nr:glutamate formimidoyltransferase [Candidatus Eremiobacteraeota bacterium]